MRILFIGDVFGSTGRRILAENLKDTVTENRIDVCIANGENVAGGKGITLNILKKLRRHGVDIITGGNHSMHDEDIYFSTPPIQHLLRPINYKDEKRGIGETIYTLPDGRKLGVISLIGRTYFDGEIDNPFTSGLEAIERMSKQTPVIIIDFHAEATSEKVCLAHYLDGKVSAVLGTHTHVQTADDRVQPKGTAYITDVGMTGPEDSAIGMKFYQVIERFLHHTPTRFEPASKGPMFNAVILDIDDKSGKALSIDRIYKRISFKE
jgi:metallophosphoesterase (TIGR00282 family)